VHFPFVYPEGPGPFPNFQFGSLMPLYVPGYFNHNQTQMAEHYSLSIQRQLDRATVVTIAYVGTEGHHIQRGQNIVYGSAPLCEALAGSGCGPGGEAGVYTLNGQNYYGSMIGLIDNQTISPKYENSSGGPVVAFAEANWIINNANSNYNSLQASVERRAHDVTFLVSYTYAKSLDDASAIYNPYNPSRTYGPSTFDMRQNLVLSYNWNVPFDRWFGARRISQGWYITGITRFYTGVPISLASTGDFALTNIGLDYPNQIAPLQKENPHDPAHLYFNPADFASNLSCGYEVCGVTGSARQFSFNGPGAINTDAGVEKATKISERVALNFRIEMFNIFNHPNFLSSAVVGNAASGQFGQATNTAPGRIGQISGKLIF